jgi:hypothetical protein
VSQICFYLDEDTINAALIKALRNANLNVVTVADAGRFEMGLHLGAFWESQTLAIQLGEIWLRLRHGH